MRSREVFGVIVRTIGLITLMYGLYKLAETDWVHVGPQFRDTFLPVAAGLYLLRGAPLLVAFGYAPPRASRRAKRRNGVSNPPMQTDAPAGHR
jgi:hypothetical protein